ncbi:MAG: hypothetical protein PWQ14_447, partial [Rikenellaceae bacterium]|nr:hypothetical protein [Rikenellaceae bacterium]
SLKNFKINFLNYHFVNNSSNNPKKINHSTTYHAISKSHIVKITLK